MTTNVLTTRILTLAFSALLLLPSIASAQIYVNSTFPFPFVGETAVGNYYHNSGTIASVRINGGSWESLLENSGTAGLVVMNGGTVINTGRIHDLIYTGGEYAGYYYDWYSGQEQYGSVGTVTIAGGLSRSYGFGLLQGSVEHYRFANDGSGVLGISLNPNANGDSPVHSWNSNTTINLNYGHIVLDVTRWDDGFIGIDE